MSDNLGLILLLACGFGLVCMVIGIVMFSAVQGLFRRFFIVGIVQRVIGDTKEDVDEEVPDDHDVQHITSADLRAKAQSLDFDSAVQKYAAGAPPTLSAQAAPKPGQLQDEPLRTRPLRRVEHDPLDDTDDD